MTPRAYSDRTAFSLPMFWPIAAATALFETEPDIARWIGAGDS
jgi:hypothetical protein